MSTTHEEQQKLLTLVREAIREDNALREKYQIGEKFRFIRDRLHALLSYLEESIKTTAAEAPADKMLAEDEQMLYVYLFNSQGIVLPSWQKMLIPSVFYEYSINRPIYTDKNHIDAFIRSRKSPAQHGYLTIAVKKEQVLTQDTTQDAVGNPLIKVKEGALKADRLFTFTHHGIDYEVSETGDLTKKM